MDALTLEQLPDDVASLKNIIAALMKEASSV